MFRRSRVAAAILILAPAHACGRAAPDDDRGESAPTGQAAAGTTETPAPTPTPTSTSAATGAAAEVKTAFEAYRRALLAGDGEAAAGAVLSSTHGAFARYRRLALTASRAEIQALGAMDRMMVLATRFRVPADRLRSLDGRGLFAHAVQEGMVGKESVQNSQIAEPTIDGDSAHVPILAAGKPMPFGFSFGREGATWKLDLAALFGSMNDAFAEILKTVDPDPDAAIMKLLERTTGKPVGPEIWTPPGL
jgi:cell division septation protein DedD